MHALYANCFAPSIGADIVLTEESAVADATPHGARSLIVDQLIEPDRGNDADIQLWDLAFRWARIGGSDPTVVDGVSAADLGGAECAIRTLIPAGRGALGMLAALDAGVAFDSLTTATASAAPPPYRQLETVQARAAVAAAQARLGADLAVEAVVGHDERNEPLIAKYAATRDVEWLDPALNAGRAKRIAVTRVVNLLAATRHRARGRTLLVYEYNPTHAFSETYASRRDRDWRLVRHRCPPSALPSIIAAGDRLSMPPPYPPDLTAGDAAARLRQVYTERVGELEAAFTLQGVPLWHVVAPALIATAERYIAFSQVVVPALRDELDRFGVDAVLVPAESPPEARAIVQVARSMGIPTHVINDGYKGDDFAVDGMLSDVALSWSEGISRNFFARRTHGRVEVTGNPKADRQAVSRKPRSPQAGPLRILVGSFTFSPADINCRRSDSERFLDGVLDGIVQSEAARGASVTIKLHPADRAGHYAEILDRFAQLRPEIVDSGDVVDMLEACDVYVTTYSTSLIEAVAMDVPVIYFRVNDQCVHPPFADDPYLFTRTAGDAQAVAALLDGVHAGRRGDASTPGRQWAEQYLGPADGRSVDRIIAAIDRTVVDGRIGSA